MRILYFADIVGRPGRGMLRTHLDRIKQKFDIDLTIANYENASHGFGLSKKNAKELLNMGIDIMTGGNHSWDKKEIIEVMDELPIIRPLNLPVKAPGSGIKRVKINKKELIVINLMGYYGMPMVDNPFTKIVDVIEELKQNGVEHIVIDFHAEATSEKRALLVLLKGKVSAIIGSHTHVGTDDLIIDNGTFYVTDVGLTGCRDNVIGMDIKEPLDRFLTSVSSKFDVPKKCKKILQGVIFDIGDDGKVTKAFKIKAYDEKEVFISLEAYCEE